MNASVSDARPGLLRTVAGIATNACVVRYRLDKPTGPLHALAAVLDPFVYAGTVYFVLATVFGRDDPARFHLLLLGFIAFRWTLSCLIQALKLRIIRERLSEVTPYDYVGSIVAVMAPSTLAFLTSLMLALGWTLIAASPGRSLAALWALPGVVVFQGLWNVALILIVDLFHRARVGVSDVSIIAFAVIVWFLSPFMYRLDEIPAPASRILTSFNPVSHVIAAYQNAYWYGRIPSLNVLPATAVVMIGGIELLRRFGRRRQDRSVASAFSATSDTTPQIVIMSNDAPHLAIVHASTPKDRPQVFSRWHGRAGDFRGAGLVRLILAARGLSLAEIQHTLPRVQDASGVGRLFDEDIGVYPDWARDQLAFAIVMDSPGRNLVLVGLLNSVGMEFLAKAWKRIESDAAAGKIISIIAERPLHLPASAHGTFRIVGSTGVSAEGRIGGTLMSEYERARTGTNAASHAP